MKTMSSSPCACKSSIRLLDRYCRCYCEGRSVVLKENVDEGLVFETLFSSISRMARNLGARNTCDFSRELWRPRSGTVQRLPRSNRGQPTSDFNHIQHLLMSVSTTSHLRSTKIIGQGGNLQSTKGVNQRVIGASPYA